jgi:hypothetical protein
MKTLPHIEVEPLADPRWEKIERSLLARVERGMVGMPDFLERRGRRWAHPGLLVAAVALFSVLGFALFATREEPQHASFGIASHITTGPKASHLALAGLALDVEPHSEVVVGAETSQGLLIVLDRGSIVCEVAARSSDKPLIVQAGAARVRVLGTRFSVVRNGEAAQVKVEHGAVEVSSSGKKWRVQAGQEWPAAAASGSSASAPEVAKLEPREEARTSPPADAPPTRTGPRSRGSRPASSAVAAAETTVVPESAPKPTISRQAVFEQATALERSDPARAGQLYRTLESGGDSWGQNALYARGRLEAARGNHKLARGLLTQYLERFPLGTNAEDARAVLRRLP